MIYNEWYMYKPNNAPAPDELLLTAREALKTVLSEPGADFHYTILMAMNAMGIAARAMQAEAPPPAGGDRDDAAFTQWLRGADKSAIRDETLVTNLRRHVEAKLAVANPRFKPEPPKE